MLGHWLQGMSFAKHSDRFLKKTRDPGVHGSIAEATSNLAKRKDLAVSNSTPLILALSRGSRAERRRVEEGYGTRSFGGMESGNAQQDLKSVFHRGCEQREKSLLGEGKRVPVA